MLKAHVQRRELLLSGGCQASAGPGSIALNFSQVPAEVSSGRLFSVMSCRYSGAHTLTTTEVTPYPRDLSRKSLGVARSFFRSPSPSLRF